MFKGRADKIPGDYRSLTNLKTIFLRFTASHILMLSICGVIVVVWGNVGACDCNSCYLW